MVVEMGKVDREETKMEKPKAIYHNCGRIGGTDLNDQLLNYYTFLQKGLKWSRKLLIHLFNMVILNAHILKKYLKKLSHDAFRDRLIKFLIGNGLKSYNIPLSLVISRKIGKYNEIEFQDKRLNERHFPLTSQQQKGGKRKDRLNSYLISIHPIPSILKLVAVILVCTVVRLHIYSQSTCITILCPLLLQILLFQIMVIIGDMYSDDGQEEYKRETTLEPIVVPSSIFKLLILPFSQCKHSPGKSYPLY